MAPTAVAALDAGLAAELGPLLAESGYTAEGIRGAIGGDPDEFKFADTPVFLRRLEEGTLATLIRLFFLETAVPPEEAGRAGVPDALLEPVAGGVEATIRFEPYEGLVVACDRYRLAERGGMTSDHVSGINVSTLMLATLALRRPVATALDVGTGSGIQALLAARHADEVTATDINPRALAFARFNAHLNGVDNVVCLEGSFYEPVRRRRFDLVVSNPPFVISPETRYVFRDSGRRGDGLSLELVQGVPSLLADDGVAHVLASWGLADGEPWWARPESWVEGLGCDAWVLLYKAEDPLDSAAAWARAFDGADDTTFARALDRWHGFYRELGLAGIAYGAFTLRRREGAGWFRVDELPEPLPIATESMLELFARQDFLARLSGEEALMDAVLVAAAGHVLEQSLRKGDDGYVVESRSLRLEHGLRSTVAIDRYTVRLLAFCDGTRPVGEFVAELAAEREIGHHQAADEVLPVARRLVELGFLEPAAPGGASE